VGWREAELTNETYVVWEARDWEREGRGMESERMGAERGGGGQAGKEEMEKRGRRGVGREKR
jgi:hypothetical protein